MIGIVVSKADAVGKNSVPILIDNGFKHENGHLKKNDLVVVEKEEDVIYLEDLDSIAKEFSIDYFIVISRHKAEKGIKTMSVHAPGNWSKAKYGGNDRELQMTFANGMRNVFLEMLSKRPDGYHVTLEATHHGPTKFETPLFFAEVGSTEREWNDMEAVGALVDSILSGVRRKKKTNVAIGFGGTHYAPKFTPLEETIAFSHICPKYYADDLDSSMVTQMIEKTSDGVDFAIIDDKGLKGRQKTLIKSLLYEIGLEFQV